MGQTAGRGLHWGVKTLASCTLEPAVLWLRQRGREGADPGLALDPVVPGVWGGHSVESWI